jgi:hypothetical protein
MENMKDTKFDRIIDELRVMGEHLIPLNFPRNDPNLENDISVLKKAEVVIDGYNIVIKFNKAEYFNQKEGDDYVLETFQLTGKDIPFLPFALVVKIGRRVLGGHHLSLVEFFNENRKVYCWSVCLDKRGRPISPPFEQEMKKCSYEGFEYDFIDSDELSFY